MEINGVFYLKHLPSHMLVKPTCVDADHHGASKAEKLFVQYATTILVIQSFTN